MRHILQTILYDTNMSVCSCVYVYVLLHFEGDKFKLTFFELSKKNINRNFRPTKIYVAALPRNRTSHCDLLFFFEVCVSLFDCREKVAHCKKKFNC